MQSTMIKLSAIPAHDMHQGQHAHENLRQTTDPQRHRSSHDGDLHEFRMNTCLHPGKVGEGGIYRHSKDLHQPCCSSAPIGKSCLQDTHHKRSSEWSLHHGRDDTTEYEKGHLCIFALEVSMAVRESSDLCWAHEGEVQWVEEQHNILALQADAILASTQPATICSSLSAARSPPLLSEALSTVICDEKAKQLERTRSCRAKVVCTL